MACRAQETDKEASGASGAKSDSAARQLLGIRGGGDETNIWKIRLQLMKPVTWVPLIWGMLLPSKPVDCAHAGSMLLIACVHDQPHTQLTAC